LLILFLVCSFTASLPLAYGQSTGTIKGKVKNLKIGTGIENAQVECSGPSHGSTATDAYGNYTITGLAPGPYTIAITALGYVQKTHSTFIYPTMNTPPDFMLNMLSIRGRVHDAASPSTGIAEANITIGEEIRLTNSTGHYEWLDLSNGTYTLMVSAPGYASQTQQVTVSTGNTQLADFASASVPAGRISGTVTDDATRDPVNQATVRVRRGSWEREATTDLNGQYSIENVPAWASWTVDAYKVGYVAQSTTASVQSGATTSLNFALVPFGRITGTVRDQTTNQPIDQALVKADSEFLNTTDANGYYTIFALAGTYTVTASAPGYSSSSQGNIRVRAGGTETVNFLLQSVPPGNIVGNVTDATTGSPIVGATVTADVGYSNITDSDGRYTLSNLPAWTYTVNVSATGFIGDTILRSVPSSGSITADFQLAPFTRIRLEPYVNFGNPGQSFNVNLDVADARFVHSWDAYLWWNPALFDVSTASEGDFLKGEFGNRTTQFSYETYPNEGVIRMRGWSSLATLDSGVSGSGTLALLTLQVKAKGACTIDVTNALLYDPGAMPSFPNAMEDAVFRTLQGDVNNDGTVDKPDLDVVVGLYGSKFGDPSWNASADVNSDHVIDVFDEHRVGRDYGQSI